MRRSLFLAINLAFLLSFSVKAQETQEQHYPSRLELIPFQSLNLSDEQILKGQANGPAVNLAGELRLPSNSKEKKYPLVIIVHGSSGINAATLSWAYQLNAVGIATFILDSFSGRGLTSVSTDQAKLARFAGVIDVFRAFELLSKHPKIDSNKVALIGSSRGGTAVIYAAMRRFQKTWSPDFKAVSTYPFYPSCFDQIDQDEDVTMPIHEYHGDRDDYASSEQCKKWIQRLSSNGAIASSKEYKGAEHSFDNIMASSVPSVSNGAQSTRNCHIIEKEGQLFNTDTQKPFTYKDQCVSLNPRTGFNKEATLDAHHEVIEDLKKVFFGPN